MHVNVVGQIAFNTVLTICADAGAVDDRPFHQCGFTAR